MSQLTAQAVVFNSQINDSYELVQMIHKTDVNSLVSKQFDLDSHSLWIVQSSQLTPSIILEPFLHYVSFKMNQ